MLSIAKPYSISRNYREMHIKDMEMEFLFDRALNSNYFMYKAYFFSEEILCIKITLLNVEF